MKPTDMLDIAVLSDRPATLPKGVSSTVIKPGQCMKRDFILCAAARVFYRDGFQGASIDLIASEAVYLARRSIITIVIKKHCWRPLWMTLSTG
jgi:hypothetical protein